MCRTSSKIHPKRLAKQLTKLLWKEGCHEAETILTEALTKRVQQELALAEGKLSQKAAQEAIVQVEKRTVSKVSKNPVSDKVTKELQTLKSKESLSTQEIVRLESEISSWLGEETRLIRNRAEDPIFLSKDCTRRVRFDFNRPYPHENPHLHFEKRVNGEWEQIKKIYPSDVPHK